MLALLLVTCALAVVIEEYSADKCVMTGTYELYQSDSSWWTLACAQGKMRWAVHRRVVDHVLETYVGASDDASTMCSGVSGTHTSSVVCETMVGMIYTYDCRSTYNYTDLSSTLTRYLTRTSDHTSNIAPNIRSSDHHFKSLFDGRPNASDAYVFASMISVIAHLIITRCLHCYRSTRRQIVVQRIIFWC